MTHKNDRVLSVKETGPREGEGALYPRRRRRARGHPRERSLTGVPG
ncbi:MAG TPA: hypothetical protein VIY52_36110 [Streptosporangiaceae bacterium]